MIQEFDLEEDFIFKSFDMGDFIVFEKVKMFLDEYNSDQTNGKKTTRKKAIDIVKNYII